MLMQGVVFLLGVAWLFTCAVPLTLGTIEWAFDIGGSRTKRRRP
jgi:hypothetical protein